jgi:hypothetical protein
MIAVGFKIKSFLSSRANYYEGMGTLVQRVTVRRYLKNLLALLFRQDVSEFFNN